MQRHHDKHKTQEKKSNKNIKREKSHHFCKFADIGTDHIVSETFPLPGKKNAAPCCVEPSTIEVAFRKSVPAFTDVETHEEASTLQCRIVDAPVLVLAMYRSDDWACAAAPRSERSVTPG